MIQLSMYIRSESICKPIDRNHDEPRRNIPVWLSFDDLSFHKRLSDAAVLVVILDRDAVERQLIDIDRGEQELSFSLRGDHDSSIAIVAIPRDIEIAISVSSIRGLELELIVVFVSVGDLHIVILI